MRELTDEQEEALGLAYAHKNEQSQMYEGPAARAFLQLKDTRMLKVDGDLSGNALVERVLPAGVEHMSLVRESLAAAGVELLSDIFSRVYENPYVLRTEGNTQLFALYAAISSESDSAVKLWRRLVKGVLERKSPYHVE